MRIEIYALNHSPANEISPIIIYHHKVAFAYYGPHMILSLAPTAAVSAIVACKI